MQLTVDAAPPIDIEYKMSTIKEVSLNEIITNNIVEMFSNEIKKSDDIVKNDELPIGNNESQNIHLNNKDKQDDATIATESKIENNTCEESVVDNCVVKNSSCNVKNNKEEINNIVDDDDVAINQQQELESQNKLNNIDLEEDENVNKMESNDINEQRSSLITSESEMKDQLNDDDINTKNPEDTINVNKTENKEIIDKEKNNVKETNNDTECSDTENSVSHSVTDEVLNEIITDEVFKEKKEESLEDVSQSSISQCENTVSQTLLEININQNEPGKVDQEADLIEGSPKGEISVKEKEITEESATITESDVKNSPIEILEKKTDDGEESSNDVDSTIDKDQPKSPQISKSSNVLDILSDDEDEHRKDIDDVEKSNNEKQCISLVDDDDVMLIDEETSVKEDTNSISINANNIVPETCDVSAAPSQENISEDNVTDVDATETEELADSLKDNELGGNNDITENITSKPLLPINFLNSCKKNLADMTREDLEDFCSLKIVESVMDRSNLGELKSQIKTMAEAIEEFKKKTTLLTKQNKDLQLVLKSIQDVQKNSAYTPITPLKITRSVGMQVLMTDKPNAKRKNAQIVNSNAVPNQPLPIEKSNRSTASKGQKTKNQPIPVPRLVPAPSAVNKANSTAPSSSSDPGKSPQMPPVNGLRISTDTQKPEKRSRLQSVTVDLTDDEPPMKLTARSSPAPAVRLVPAQNLLPPQRPQFAPTMTSPRKVYIPISGPQSQNVRPGQTVVLKAVPPNSVPRPRMPANNMNKMQTNTIRMNRALPTSRHPAPLPDAVKQYQPTSWKALPPAPDLKLSKVENGIVISWKIDGYQDDSYEEIISYQLFAYQETNSPPSTALWKKIGDVKALPLPMACTLTQFLAGYKYYFAVRAVDVKSRFGPFSLPASILLLNKM